MTEIHPVVRALLNLPTEIKAEALCLLAVQQDRAALRFVPDEHKSEAVCLAAVHSRPSSRTGMRCNTCPMICATG
jgi:hypothetical protein